ncbi:hypothetical protein I6H88_11315 [Elizabethkingia bruuniana]|uniref:Uncharacterized protein n=1 Tax=Elizabethkingia bruuniana TaxID=1756149 RepID=A0A7T7UVW0_9FLAO|nr:hypothetical protein [Elizabethkingia bruuniana]AQX83650.1 hypothetical protein AYC65_00825 [Elizabethkingia bruuniana]KUY22235.1 hypothetical protein ATB97_13370 [Elizabethkingia bruuniana]OPB62446.1 hypothetical protein BAY12_11110 [Elizabethkingia bruuniana]QQN57051.1 hypothetical protein I6H88_11315 [Elizabethkingia bruuniana]
MKINLENQLLLRLMTFVPPFLGIIVFSYIVKFSHFENVTNRLPIYQGISSYFSLILIGFTYIKNRNAIKGRKILLPLTVVILIPLVGYYFANIDICTTTLILLVSFLSSAILYIMLVRKKMFNYLLFSIINSVLLPTTLFVNTIVFVLIIIGLLIILYYVYSSVKKRLVVFNYSDGGIDILNSILLHSPYILFPFFDFLIQRAIGTKHYNDYVLINKYINGGITLLFSYKQLSLMFSGELKRKGAIIMALISILILSILGVFINNWVVFIIMIGLYSFGVNLSSLVVRSKLMSGIYFWISMIGPVFVGLYVLSLFFFKNNIEENNHLFVFFMTIFTIVPSFLLLTFYYKQKLSA